MRVLSYALFGLILASGCGGEREAGPESDSRAVSYPADCAQVANFQCGFSATCRGGVVAADWHEHVYGWGPEAEEEIVSFSCTTVCPGGCQPNASDWPTDGTELVAKYCLP